MADREIYPHAPIALVVAEIRHPVRRKLSAAEVEAVGAVLRDALPILRVEQVVDVALPSGKQQVSHHPRFVSRSLHQSVTLRPDAVAVETTSYEGWEAFSALVATALHARNDIAPLDGVERIGLRYIDELRVPSEAGATNWSEWVAPELLGPQGLSSVLGAPIGESQGVAIVRTKPGLSYTVRYGIGDGQAVVSSPNLVRPAEGSGPFFLIDMDGAWQPVSRGIPEFDPLFVTDMLDALHVPIRSVFESLITEKLRQEVLR